MSQGEAARNSPGARPGMAARLRRFNLTGDRP